MLLDLLETRMLCFLMSGYESKGINKNPHFFCCSKNEVVSIFLKLSYHCMVMGEILALKYVSR